MYKEFLEKVRAAGTIVIFGHKNPDGDSLGSALALKHLIKDNIGTDATVLYDGNLPIFLDFLPGRGDAIYVGKLQKTDFDLCIMVDVGSERQIDEAQKKVFDAAKDTIKIDHHITHDIDAKLNIVDSVKASTTQIVFGLACELGWKISTDVATNIMTGLIHDTGGFSHEVNGDVMRVAAELLDIGIDMKYIRNGLRISTKDDIMGQAYSLMNAEFYYGGRLAVATVPNRYYKKLDSGETPILGYLQRIKGVEFTAVLKEAHTSGMIGISLRSKTVPVRPVAEIFGGGGHDFASGCRINNTTLSQAKEIIVAEFEGM
ncbi:MAG: bifunctional oligoribonuclease/PAP phosphatase NrnA [Alphaproteobacteria bacterium]|nr:bifunctional oligoribonuclease/PAP phosphatase NrnA [Alphaproteobacteria bacterium]